MAKGFILGDMIYLMLIVFVVSIGALFGYKILGAIPTISEAQENQTIAGMEALQFFDIGGLIIAVGMGLVIIIVSFMIPSHPIFLIPGIITLVILMLIAPLFSNIMEKLFNSGMVDAEAFPLSQSMWHLWPTIIGILGIVIIIAMYAKTRLSLGSGGMA